MLYPECKCDMLGYVSKGLHSVNDDAAKTIEQFLLSQVADDGGIVGRDGKSDLYYTVFGIQLLAAFKPNKLLRKVAKFIKNFDPEGLDFVHSVSLIRCLAWLDPDSKSEIFFLLDRMEKFRSRDGGYNHLSPNAPTGTIYAAFLAHLAYQETGRMVPDGKLMTASINALQLPDGSFSNDSGLVSGATSTTAAAMVLLNDFKLNIGRNTIENQLSRADKNGGFRAGPQSPVPDLLSTATALFAMKKAGYDCSGITGAHAAYAGALWNQDGGFSGHVFDDVSDCEYTFYALLVLGLNSP